MSNSTTAHELRIRFYDRKAVWIGTRIQLEAEGFAPPANTAWPLGRKSLHLKLGRAWACVYRADATNDDPTPETVYRVDHYSNQGDHIKRSLEQRLKEVKALLSYGDPEWSKAWDLHWKARRDSKFQEFKRALLGQKKRGRKPGVVNQRKQQA